MLFGKRILEGFLTFVSIADETIAREYSRVGLLCKRDTDRPDPTHRGLFSCPVRFAAISQGNPPRFPGTVSPPQSKGCLLQNPQHRHFFSPRGYLYFFITVVTIQYQSPLID